MDLAGAVGGDAGERAHVLGGWDCQKECVDLGAPGSVGCRHADGRPAGRVVEAVDELVEVTPSRSVEFDQFDRCGG
jgi:hypothetical protein